MPEEDNGLWTKASHSQPSFRFSITEYQIVLVYWIVKNLNENKVSELFNCIRFYILNIIVSYERY